MTGDGESEGGGRAYDEDDVETVVDRAVPDDATPSFYAIAGSRIYGFPSERGGDVDVRGFHAVDGDRYLELDGPREQFVVNQGGVTPGFEEYGDIDLVSYELKKFGSLLHGANFNALEVVFDGIEVLNDVPSEMRSLRALIEDELPLDVPKTYHGMARSNRRRFLDPDGGAYDPRAKIYLYVLRGLVASEYVRREGTIAADITALVDWYGDDALRDVVDELIAEKRRGEGERVGDRLAAEADGWIERLFDESDPPEGATKEAYRERLNGWMLTVRG